MTIRPVLFVVLAAVMLVTRPAVVAQATAYTVYAGDGRTSLPFRAVGSADMVPLDQVASLFGLTIAEDPVVGGFTLKGRGQTILLIPGQSFASIGPGRIVSLSAPVQRDRNAWSVPVDFMQKAVGPAQNIRVEIRKATHTILIGEVRLPQVVARFERQGPNARLTLEIQPSAPHRVTRVGERLTVKFDAIALDWTAASGVPTEFITSIRTDGASVLVDLGPAAAGYRAEDIDATHLVIDLLAPTPVAPPPPPASALPPVPAPVPGRSQSPEPGSPARPAIEVNSGIRTIVIDPGHGGDDAGAKGEHGTVEKDLALQFARKLKGAIESRIGLRVILTRDTDDNVPVDRRAAVANNNKADLFISVHANASVRPTVAGLQVLSLRLDDYSSRAGAPTGPDSPLAVVGGGTRTIEILPWDTAQVGFTEDSAGIATLLRRHLTDEHVTLFGPNTSQLPLRPLVGISMPAILVELGFLTNAAEEQALVSGDRQQLVIDAILATITDIRRGTPDDTSDRADR